MDVDLEELTRALGREVTSYTIEEIDPALRMHSVTGGVYRVRADADSLVIKVVKHATGGVPGELWAGGSEPADRNYWKREWLAYHSGFLDAIPGELRAPRTLLATEPAEDACWIWMEDVEGRSGVGWPVDDYDSVAFDLATTQAAYASGRSILPTQPWLSRHWLRGWVDTMAHQVGALDDASLWREPWQAAITALVPRVREVWTAREQLLDIVESAPQTVVHYDFWPSNLVAADDGTTVALDWSQVGIGSVAQDLDQLTLDPVWMMVLPEAPLDDLEAHVLPGYLSGLRASGFEIDEAALRRWYAAAASLRYAPLAAYQAMNVFDPRQVAASERRFGLPYQEIIRHKTRVLERAVELAEWVLN